MKKTVIASLVLLCLATKLLWAGPFDQEIPFTQPDGTVIRLHGRGNEFYAVFETLNGYTVVFDPVSRAYCYATPAATGDLVSTGTQVHQGNPVALGLEPHARMSAEARRRQIAGRRQRREAALGIELKWQERKASVRQSYEQRSRDAASAKGLHPSPPSFAVTGTKIGLTLLVDFSDAPASISQAEINRFCNADNYTGSGNNGSVKQYFRDNSGGLLTYSNVVTIYIRAPRPKNYYNDTTKEEGDQANVLIKDVLDTMKALPNYAKDILPMFANLTLDASNRLVACNVFFAGANSGVWTKGLWPHSWSLYNVGAQELGNGMKIYKYQLTNIGSTPTLGTFCHENGHMLCDYPDLYDYDAARQK